PYPGLLLARAVAPAMVAAGSGLIALVSFGTAEGYLGDVYYDLAKATTNRLAFAFGEELRPHGVTALALSPGFVRTERVCDLGQGALATESPLYAGRALAALAADGSEFATRTRTTLLEKSPSSLVLTLRLLRLGRTSARLEDCLEREFHASLALLAEGDFREGIRAAVIDKDKTPRWSPTTLDAVDLERIEAWLAPRAAPVFPVPADASRPAPASRGAR
ncbi:SDR family NAD(P)-dependent oxidoreductase, partial [Methylobacterium sp. WL122]